MVISDKWLISNNSISDNWACNQEHSDKVLIYMVEDKLYIILPAYSLALSIG